MKKIIIGLALVVSAFITKAQLFTDNFDNYSLGPLCPQAAQWTTWSGNEGGTEDAMVSTTQALSGTQSVYLNSVAANGGPQDILLNLGQQYTSGIFTFETAMFIPTGKQAYFNYQANSTPGQIWGLNFNAANGTFTFDDGITSNLVSSSYPINTWFTIRVESNLTLGLWEAFIDNLSVGTWVNGVNNVAAVNFYPHNGSAAYYIDDVMFDHEAYTLPTLNAIASMLTMNGNIASQVVSPTASILNGGLNAITSFDATLNYNGNNYTQNVSGINLVSLESYTLNFGNLSLVAGLNAATLTISNINGGNDNNSNDNVLTMNINPVVPAPGKMVVGEEGTGTWCQWCPRGSVFMDKFEQEFDGFWAGIAVHNADPMTVPVYDGGIGQLIGGYPSALVDRGDDVDPSNMYNDFYARLQIPPVAFISTNQTYNATTRVLTVEVSANFQAAANNNYKLACVLTEDEVTGTGTGWSQSNAYAGGNNGAMGGYELLPNPVPATQMVYDHVARAIEPAFAGDPTSFPALVNAGETHTKTYTFTLPATWNENKINIIGMILDPSGKIDNASKFKLSSILDVDDALTLENQFSLYPNPTSSSTVLTINIQNNSMVEVAIIDAQGKIILSKNYGALQGHQNIEMNTSLLNSGVYFIQVSIDGMPTTHRIVIQ